MADSNEDQKKMVQRQIGEMLDMLRDLNEVGALSGLAFAATRVASLPPLWGRACVGEDSYAMLGALHIATSDLASLLNGRSDPYGEADS
jgi:hypothetical protein